MKDDKNPPTVVEVEGFGMTVQFGSIAVDTPPTRLDRMRAWLWRALVWALRAVQVFELLKDFPLFRNAEPKATR